MTKSKPYTGDLDPGLLPRDRQLVCEAKSPIVIVIDITSSMGKLAVIFLNEMSRIAKQVGNYVDNPQISICAVGDITCDPIPIQISDFSKPRNLASWARRILITPEVTGGPDDFQESYEMPAYYYLEMTELPNAETPLMIFIGDEAMRGNLDSNDLERHFGGQRQDTSARQVFALLQAKFKENLFLIHRPCPIQETDEAILRQWGKLIGKERLLTLAGDMSTADVLLGIVALVHGKSFAEYSEDMAETGQSVARIKATFKALDFLQPLFSDGASTDAPKKKPARKTAPKKSGPDVLAVPVEKKKKKARPSQKPKESDAFRL